MGGYNKVQTAVEDLSVLAEFHEAGEASEEEVNTQYSTALSLTEELESKNMLRNEEDSLGAILKINSGAGGTEGTQAWGPLDSAWIRDRAFDLCAPLYATADPQ